MMRRFRGLRRAAIGVLAGLLLTSASAQAGQSFGGALTHGKPLVDIRLRSETVDDENCAACAGRAAQAYTARARLGYETAKWNQLSFLAEVDIVGALGQYNNTRNGKSLYPIVADPNLFILNRLQLSYTYAIDTKFVLGRQRITLGNQRFIGNVGWRQHEQTYDAFSVTNASVRNLTLTYAYIDRVNRVFGPGTPKPLTGQPDHYDSNSHIVNAAYVGIAGLRLEAYAYLLDLGQAGASPLVAKRLSTATYGLRAEQKFDITPTIKGLVNAEYAHQTDYAENPLDLSLNYFLGEAGFTWKGLTATGAIESLGSDRATGFSTPLATLHAFNGWADVFLATPAAGLNDKYGKIAYTMKDVLGLPAVTATVFYHDFSAARGGTNFGKEWDASIGATITKQVSVLAKYANFDGTGPFRDKSILWFQLEYKL